MIPVEAGASAGEATLGWKDSDAGIAVLTLTSDETVDIQWSIRLEQAPSAHRGITTRRIWEREQVRQCNSEIFAHMITNENN